MKCVEFVERITRDERTQPSFPALRDTLRGLANDADSLPVIIGGGKIQYSRHVDKNVTKSSNHWISSCHKDTIEHKDTC